MSNDTRGPVCHPVQRLGALGEALAAAYTCVRSEVQSGALPPKVGGRRVRSGGLGQGRVTEGGAAAKGGLAEGEWACRGRARVE